MKLRRNITRKAFRRPVLIAGVVVIVLMAMSSVSRVGIEISLPQWSRQVTLQSGRLTVWYSFDALPPRQRESNTRLIFEMLDNPDFGLLPYRSGTRLSYTDGSVSSSRQTWAYPLWVLLPPLIGMGIWVWSPSRVPRGHCPGCRYNLDGIESGRCPECGKSFRRRK